MTLIEAKNLVAKQYGYDKWEPKIYENGADMMENIYQKIIMLYIGCNKFKDGYGICDDECYYLKSGLKSCNEKLCDADTWTLLMSAIEYFEKTTRYSFRISKTGCWIDGEDGMAVFHSSVNSYQKSNTKTKLETVKDCIDWLYKNRE